MVFAPLFGASSVSLAAESKPRPAPARPVKVVVVASSVSATQTTWPSVDGTISTKFSAPTAYDCTGLVAPSYAVWLTDPPHGAPLGEEFVTAKLTSFQLAVLQRDIAMPPLASPAEAAIPITIPLPPKRLAEQRAIVMASFAPLPPRRQTEAAAEVAPALAALEQAVPESAAPPPDEAAVDDASAPMQDAAAPIDDTPEPVEPPAKPGRLTADRGPPKIEALIERHAARYQIPARLLRRVVWRESKYNPALRHGPYWGLMQIRVDTARGLGFRGAPTDLLDANINMTYAAAYLANAYRVAGRDEKRAVMLYAGGYYYEAKRKGMLGTLIRTASAEE